MKEKSLDNQYILGFTARIRRINELMVDLGRSVYKEMALDLEPNWHLVLLLLEEKQHLPVCDIAKYLGFSHPAIIKLLKKMEDRGYVCKEKDSADNRKQLVCLTEKAKKRMPEFKQRWTIIVDTLSEYISEEFMLDLAKLENKMRTREVIQQIMNKLP